MEVTGAKRIFGRSIAKYKLRYTKFYGDGGSKSFPVVKNLYPGIEVSKLEWVGHVQKRVGTNLFHVASSGKNNYHAHCPTDEFSWCRFNSDQANNTSTYKPGPGLPQEIIAKLKPMYNDLSSKELLTKCLHGKKKKLKRVLQWNDLGADTKNKVCIV